VPDANHAFVQQQIERMTGPEERRLEENEGQCPSNRTFFQEKDEFFQMLDRLLVEENGSGIMEQMEKIVCLRIKKKLL
jgi:hypothetical protein